MQEGYKYDAFISYRHTEPDKTIVEKLHRMLEGYKVPKAVVKRGNPKKIGRVFRDRDELPTSSNLADNIQQALVSAGHLIVVCSPRTPASEWVKKEIETFGTLHGYDKILALLIEGEPAESFPQQLRFIKEKVVGDDGTESEIIREVEPLAADIRAESIGGMRKKLKTEILRLLAPMLSCSYDDLKQRHRERFIRRVLTLSISLSLFFLAFGSFSAWQGYQIKLQSDLVKQKSDEVARQSEQIKQKSDEVARQSELIKQQSEEVARQSAQIKQKSDEVERQSELIKQQNEEVMRQSEVIQQKSDEVMRQSGVIQQKSKEVQHQSEQLKVQINKTLVGQSMYLANVSSQLLGKGDRMKAIMAAREALPKDLQQPERPYVEEAEYALCEALEVYKPESGNYYRPIATLKHKYNVKDIVISPNKKIIATTTTSDGQVYFWNAENGALMGQKNLSGKYSNTIKKLYFLNDTSLVLSNDSSLLCLDVPTFEEKWRYDGTVDDFTVSSDNAKIILAGYDILVLDSKTGLLKNTIPLFGHNKSYFLFEVNISSNSKYLCTRTSQGRILVYEFASMTLLDTFEAKYETISDIVISNDGILAVASMDDVPGQAFEYIHALEIYDLQKDNKIYGMESASLSKVRFNPFDNNELFFVTDEKLNRFDLKALKITYELVHYGYIDDYQFYNSSVVITSSEDGTIRYWDKEGKEVILRRITFYPPASRFDAAVGILAAAEGTEAYIFSPVQYEDAIRLQGHSKDISQAICSSNGKRLLTYNPYDPWGLDLWDLERKVMIGSLKAESKSSILLADFVGDHRLILALNDGTISLYDTNTLSLIKTVKMLQISDIVLSPDKSRCYARGYPEASIYDTANLNPVIGKAPYGSRPVFFSDASKLVFSTYDGLTFYDIASHSVLKEIEEDDVVDLQVSDDGKYVAYIDGHGSVHLLNSETLLQERLIETGTKAKKVYFDPRGETLFLSAEGGKFRRYELESGDMLLDSDLHQYIVDKMLFSKDLRFYITKDSFGTYIWRNDSNKPIGPMSGSLLTVDQDFTFFVNRSSMDIYIGPIYDAQTLLESSEKRLKGRFLTDAEKKELFIVE